MEQTGGDAALSFEIAKLVLQVATVAVGALLALLANRMLDNRKAERDYANKLFDAVRDDVREAMDVAAEYWAGKLKAERKLILEATIRTLQAEITRGARLLDDHCSAVEAAHLDKFVREFLKALTGADFEAASVAVNKQHILQITSAGSRLRSEFAKTRRGQLKN